MESDQVVYFFVYFVCFVVKNGVYHTTPKDVTWNSGGGPVRRSDHGADSNPLSIVQGLCPGAAEKTLGITLEVCFKTISRKNRENIRPGQGDASVVIFMQRL